MTSNKAKYNALFLIFNETYKKNTKKCESLKCQANKDNYFHDKRSNKKLMIFFYNSKQNISH